MDLTANEYDHPNMKQLIQGFPTILLFPKESKELGHSKLRPMKYGGLKQAFGILHWLQQELGGLPRYSWLHSLNPEMFTTEEREDYVPDGLGESTEEDEPDDAHDL